MQSHEYMHEYCMCVGGKHKHTYGRSGIKFTLLQGSQVIHTLPHGDFYHPDENFYHILPDDLLTLLLNLDTLNSTIVQSSSMFIHKSVSGGRA